MTLARRDLRPEIMDDPDLDPEVHRRALRGLARLNAFSGSVRAVYAALRDLAPRRGQAPLRVLDVAAGGGEVAIGVWRRARQAGREIEVDACDISPRAREITAARARSAGAEVGVFALDALRDEIPAGYDVIVTSLFLHHLSDPAATDLVRRMAAGARRRVIVNDLRRSRIDLALVSLAARLVTRSPVVHHDGARSVRAAFTRPELAALGHRAGLEGAVVRSHARCRLILTWDVPR